MKRVTSSRLLGRTIGWFASENYSTAKAPANLRSRLSLVHLEDRVTPAVFMVLNTGDDGGVDPPPSPVLDGSDNGTGTLRQAIVNANAAGGADTIVFGPLFDTAQTIVLENMLPIISADVTITGSQNAGVNTVTISGNKNHMIFNTTGAGAGSEIVFDKLNLTEGNAGTDTASTKAGAITATTQKVTVSNSNLTANTAPQGGAIRFNGTGTLNIINSSMSANFANYTIITGTGGGGVLRTTTNTVVNISNSTFSGNSSANGGGAMFLSGSLATITNTSVLNNKALASGSFAGRGGGIFFNGATKISLTDSILSGNSAGSIGGALYGGSNTTNVITITNTTINGNTSTRGAAFDGFNTGTFTVSNSSIYNNSASGTGGAFNFALAGTPTPVVSLQVSNSTFAQNTSGSGAGAIHFSNAATSSKIRNSTFTGNKSNSTSTVQGAAAGGIAIPATNAATNLILDSVILSGNTMPGGGLFHDLSIVASSSVTANFSAIGSSNGHTPVMTKTGGGNNIDYGTNLVMDSLLDNGGVPQGPTGAQINGKTINLLAGSPAINNGSNIAPALLTDQRGGTFDREIPTGKPDIGALERTPGDPSASGGPFVTINNANAATQDPYFFVINYNGDLDIDVGTLDDNDIRVTRPDGSSFLATFVSSTPAVSDPSIAAKYKISAPTGGWTFVDNGVYTIALEPNQVKVVGGSQTVPAKTIGTFSVTISTTYIVTNTADDASTVGSLRWAITQANKFLAPDIIEFDASFKSKQIIPLNGTNITISDSVTINGPGADLLTIDALGLSRIFNITNTTNYLDVTIKGMTLTGGKTTANGGAIFFNDEKLTLIGVHIHGNSAGNGGAIGNNTTANTGGPVTIHSSAITGNSAGNRGGAVMFYSTGGSIFDVRNSTISGNSAVNIGGALYGFNWNSSSHIMTITNSTITLNTATTGGGIRVSATAVPIISLKSSIVSGNTASNGPDFFNGTVNSEFSAIGDLTGTTPGTSSSDLPLGTPLNLFPLALNSGPTPTHAFPNSSPLLNAGSNPNAELFDQRGATAGFAREVPAGKPDIGAFERVSGPPVAFLANPLKNVQVDDATTNPYIFEITYDGDTAIDTATVGDAGGKDVLVTHPSGFSQFAKFLSIDDNTPGTPRTAKYQITPPGGTWDFADNGNYTITVQPFEIATIAPVLTVPETIVGFFNVGFPGTYIVTNDNDSGPGSFRQALLNSNLSIGAADKIVFDTNFFKGSMKTINLLTALPSVTDVVTITGPGSNLVTISAGNKFRHIDLTPLPSASVIEISGLTLADGSTAGNGGAINIGDENVTLDDVHLINNRAAEGGAISVAATKALLTILNSNLSKNTALGGDGGAINIGGANVALIKIDASTISGNSALGDGGALYVIDGAGLQITRSTISGNVASGSGPAPNFGGGGIYFFGAINSFNGFRISNSTISGNSHALSGGGIDFHSVTGPVPEIFNSTIVGNTASNGGGIARTAGANTLTLISTIVANNKATSGTAQDILSGPATVTVTNSAVSSDAVGALIDYGTNNNIPFGTPLLLSALADHGGPTLTHRPLPGSPLIDAGANPAPLVPLDIDQIGNTRSVNQTDIGSVEVQPFVPPVFDSLSINGGNSQRSRIRTIDVTFTTPVLAVDFQTAGLITLTRIAPTNTLGSDGLNGIGGFVVNTANGLIVTQNGANTLRLSFADIINNGVENTSLADGRWQLAITPASFTSSDSNPSQAIRRLFGDFDGNGTTDGSDIGFLGFGTNNPPFDIDNNGTIDGGDFSSLGGRFGVTI